MIEELVLPLYFYMSKIANQKNYRPIRLLALDIDGTLAANDRHEVSPRTRAALHGLEKLAVNIVLVTGRRYRSTRWVVENLGLKVHSISHGGTLLKCPNENTLHSYDLAAEEVGQLVKLAREMNMCLFGQRDSHSEGGVDFVIDSEPAANQDTTTYYEANRHFAAIFSLSSCSERFLNLGCFDTEKNLTCFAKAIEAAFPGQFNPLVLPPGPNATGWYCEITSRRADKWKALKKLGRILNIEDQEVCAVGDHLNDIPMVRQAGHGFAMSNARQELKDIADGICGSYDDDGLLPVIDYIWKFNHQGA